MNGVTEEQLLYIIANEECNIGILAKRTGLTPDQIHEAYQEVFDKGLYHELSEKARNHRFAETSGEQDTFADRIASLMEERVQTMPVYKIADEIGITKNTLYKQLDGSRKPHKATAEKIAAYFDVSMEWLLAGNG